ncbi:Zn-dependent protease with chaperone function [Allocatelliglobosispora scoriae]|uniref:Zn-dependent protease with chaperone function n=1 Tax=Allocatelliglobosispora scoriae TaxID=643052 RepID=A0A841BMY2_9ACTN|nr:M48 family metallopeptidase [Allocatelliglobosispora scoriae]MBB5868201.1 Zn-dependent protease with chaperone function [Allocatelliglobosispora scoriae]
MNFFERQRQVKRLSARLVLLFVLAVVALVAAVCLAVVVAINLVGGTVDNLPGLLIFTAIATVVVIGLASLFRTVGLRGGGGKVALELGGVLVPEDTTDLQLRRLRNVVEEIALASGVPVPEVYVLEDERAINAFAAGWSTADAAVAVTRGALDRLNRDELQGVIAHEFSHVVNGDMRLNIKLIGLLFGILFLAVIGRTFVNAGIIGGRSRDSKDGGNPLPLIGLALIAAGFLGVLAGRIIKASVSRQREYLADASAVQFTRQTAGIAGALKKIGGLEGGSKLISPKTEEVGHLLFGSGQGFSSLFATHPPLVKRIQVLEPDFNPAELQALTERWRESPPSGMAEDVALGLAGAPAQPLPHPDATVSVGPGEVSSQVGAPGDEAYRRAESILGQIPPEILARARRGDTVTPLVYGLLLSEQPDVRAKQVAILAAKHGTGIADAAVGEAVEVWGLHPLLRLPIAQLSFPVLRMHPVPRKQELIETINELIMADGRVDVFEYCFSRLLHRDLYESVYDNPPWPERKRNLATARDSIAMLLAILASVGTPDPAAAQRAFAAGVAGIAPRLDVGYAPPAQGVLALEQVWPDLDGLSPRDKSVLVEAMVAVIGSDGTMTNAEFELLRTICSMIHCPVPALTENGDRDHV